MISKKVKTIVIIVAIILVVALSASVLLSVFGVFKVKPAVKSTDKTDSRKNAVVSEIEMTVQFSPDVDWNNTHGIKLFYDDNETPYDTSDDLYYRIFRWIHPYGDGSSRQNDGFIIANQSGTWYALTEVILSDKFDLRVSSSFDKKTNTRETKFFVDGQPLKLRADDNLALTGIEIRGSSLIDYSEFVPKGTATNIEYFNGIVYLK